MYGVDSLGQVRQWGSKKNKPQNHSFTFRRVKVELEQSAWTEKHTLLENPEKNSFMSKCFWVSCDTSCPWFDSEASFIGQRHMWTDLYFFSLYV